MNITLDGKVAVVTGAASGIGLATSLQFLESQVKGVIAVDLPETPPLALGRFIDGNSPRCVYLSGDVRQEATAEAFTRLAIERFGRLDILVNNAGVSVVKAIHEHSPAEWDFVLDTNVKALFWSAKHVVPVMMRQRAGVILNTGSISGHVGIAGQGAYGPSKGAVHQMTRQMAIEYAPHGIRVNAIALGTVDTPIVHKAARDSGNPEAFMQGLMRNHPIGRIASAEEVARFFTYLASDDASFFTGAILSMDGGFTAH
jgi:meso-butanediol dehydrogenase/(S,S)-butanediol dehydrogenase/diacetyl reductase